MPTEGVAKMRGAEATQGGKARLIEVTKRASGIVKVARS